MCPRSPRLAHTAERCGFTLGASFTDVCPGTLVYREALRRRIDAVAELTGFDRERIRLWSFAQAVLSEIWSADEASRPRHVDMRAARLIHESD